jgi:transposase
LEEVEIRNGKINKLRTVSMDMSKSYISAAKEYMPNADIVFDRFHLSQNLNKAVDSVRKEEQQQHKELKKSKYLWLHRNSSLSDNKKAMVEVLSASFPNIGLAYRLKESFRQVLDNAKTDGRVKWIKAWLNQAWDSEIPQIQNFVRLIDEHWYGIKTYFKTLQNNALAERINLGIQHIKRIARGFRNMENFKFAIYFHFGGLNIPTH